MSTATPVRRDEVAANLAAVHERVRLACSAAGRDPAEVRLIAVTKTFPASDVRILVELGISEIGENREREAADKATELADLAVRWHFVGQVQTRKARSVARFAHVVHSVDRLRLVAALDRGAAEAGRSVLALVQVGLDDGAGRGGAACADVPALAEAVAAAAHLELGGVMAVAPLDRDAALAFARLADIAAQLRVDHPRATTVSAGMSADLEAAVNAGATHLRVGSALLGPRPPLG